MNKYDGYTDSQLIVLYLKYGDEDSFNELFRRYNSMLNYFASKVHLVGYDKDDIRQLCIITFLNSIKSFDVERGVSFKTYVTSCIKNTSAQLVRNALSECRNEAYTIPYSEISEVADSCVVYDDAHVTNGLVEKDMYDVMKKILSKQEYDIFINYTFGFSYIELAQKFNLTRKQVDNAICRARKKLSNYYSKMIDGEYGDNFKK